jgi:hypothetical protein
MQLFAVHLVTISLATEFVLFLNPPIPVVSFQFQPYQLSRRHIELQSGRSVELNALDIHLSLITESTAFNFYLFPTLKHNVDCMFVCR